MYMGLLYTFFVGYISYESIPDHCIVIIGVSVMSLVVFVLFAIVARRYKLRQRNDIIPYHMFAENQFESDYRQKQMYGDHFDWSE